jgi:hypothetical protein
LLGQKSNQKGHQRRKLSRFFVAQANASDAKILTVHAFVGSPPHVDRSGLYDLIKLKPSQVSVIISNFTKSFFLKDEIEIAFKLQR